LTAKADVNIQQGRHHTALQAAVIGRSLETDNLLLDARANAELAGHGSSLQLAIRQNELAIAQALISAGSHIGVSQNKPQSLLIQACNHGDISLVNTLLEAGADVQVQGHQVQGCVLPHWFLGYDKNGSALHAAIEAGHVNLICFLLSKGFNLSADFGEFRSPLAAASRKGDPDVLEVISRRASNIPDETLTEAFV
jgi:ankyrin repeat protein